MVLHISTSLIRKLDLPLSIVNFNDIHVVKRELAKYERKKIKFYIKSIT